MSKPSRAVPVSPPRPRRQWRRRALRVLVVGAFVTVAMTAVCQGFGLAGWGTEDHPWRNLATFTPLFAGGVVLVWPRRGVPLRAGAAALALALATAAWWLVPCRDGGLSLREAVTRRDELAARFGVMSPDDIESGVATKFHTDALQSQYGYLGASVRGDMWAWVYRAADDGVVKFRNTPPDDIAAARALEGRLRLLAQHFPEAGRGIGAAVDTWIGRALLQQQMELNGLDRGDWDGFGRTAPGRAAVAGIGNAAFAAGTRDELVKLEEEWVNESVEALVKREGGAGARAGLWRDTEKEILALHALDESEMRFQVARGRLFDLAHSAAESAAERLIRAERYHAALGVARRHAVEWNATATVLGVREVKRLDDLREKCAALAKPGVADPDVADEPEVAPPPRPKP